MVFRNKKKFQENWKSQTGGTYKKWLLQKRCLEKKTKKTESPKKEQINIEELTVNKKHCE